MSRMIISNATYIFKEAIKYSRESNLNRLTEVIHEHFNLAVFEKRNVFFGNIYYKNEEEYIAVTGTLLYKGKKSLEAIKLILEDFDGEVVNFKKKCLGIYSLIIRKKAHCYLFGDYYGIYDIYYHQNAGSYFISNSLSTLATVNKMKLIDFDMLMSDLLGCGHFDSPNTIFTNVSRLRGNEYIEILSNKMRVMELSEAEYLIKYNYESEEKAIEDIYQLLIQNLSEIKSNFGNVAVNLTGGLDSRCTLAALYQSGCNISLLYGEGKKGGIITCPEDKKVVQNIAKKFNLPLYYMNWEETNISNEKYLKQRQLFFKKYGFINIYDANENIRLEYEGQINPYPEFMEFGYFLEAFRLREWVEESNKECFSVNSFIDDYLFRKINQGSVGWELDSLKLKLKKEIYDWIERLRIPENKGYISIDYFEQLRWIASRFDDSRMAVYVNEFTYSFPIYGIPQIHTIILSLPAEVIRNASFQVKFIKKINSEFINDVMLFSHRRLHRIKKSGKKVKVLTFKNISDIILRKIPIIAFPLRSLYRTLIYKSYRGWENSCNEDLDKIDIQLLPMQNMKNRDIFHDYNYFLACYAKLLEDIANEGKS